MSQESENSEQGISDDGANKILFVGLSNIIIGSQKSEGEGAGSIGQPVDWRSGEEAGGND